jgi:hypothetical protein
MDAITLPPGKNYIGGSMQHFGVSAARLQMATWIVTALCLGACNVDSKGSAVQGSSTSMGTAVLTWTPPTENTNGTPLTDLAGYHIRYGTKPDALTKVIDLAGSRTTAFEVSNLSPGTYYFSISAYTSIGTESAESDVEYKSI